MLVYNDHRLVPKHSNSASCSDISIMQIEENNINKKHNQNVKQIVEQIIN